MSNIVSKIEAFLFVSSREVPLSVLSKTLGVTRDEVDEALCELKKSLEGHGLALTETHEGVAMTTAPAVADFIAEFVDSEAMEISKAGMETLSLIAYRGPVATHDVSVIRGVDSRRIIARLLRQGLIKKVSGGRNVSLYAVTADFFQHLGINAKEDLPDFDKLSNNENMRKLLEEKI